MKRFTILSLMGLVLTLALAIAALRNADDDWAGAMILATPLLLCVAAIGAFCGEGRFRDRRLGFAILGGGYFALAFLGLSKENMARLPTARLLAYVHQRVSPPQTFTFTVTGSTAAPANPGSIILTNIRPGPLNLVTTTTTTSATSAPIPDPASTAVTANRWRSLLPGAANYEAFSIVGHCLFALLAGSLGAMVARWFRRRCERAEQASRVAAE
jgi:hypothetical protein